MSVDTLEPDAEISYEGTFVTPRHNADGGQGLDCSNDLNREILRFNFPAPAGAVVPIAAILATNANKTPLFWCMRRSKVKPTDMEHLPEEKNAI